MSQKIGVAFSWMNPKLEVRTSPVSGRGVFAKEKILRKERLAIWGGQVMTFREMIEHIPENLQIYPLQIDDDRAIWVPWTSPEPEEPDFFNHSCSPNSGIKGQIFLVPMRNIEKDEEITFDYAMVLSEFKGTSYRFEMDCGCSSPECRKKVTQADWKKPELQRKYKGFFSSYLEEKILEEKRK